MADIISQLESNIVRLRSALQSSNELNIGREYQNLEDILLKENTYQFVGDERLLAEIDRILSQLVGDTDNDQLSGFRHHLASLRNVHDKLYAILDPDVDLDSLLLNYFTQWPFLETPVQVDYSTVLDDLHSARTNGDSEQKLRTFLDTYLAHLRKKGLVEIASVLEPIVRLALEGYRRLRTWRAYGLFASTEQGEVYGLQVNIMSNGEGKIRAVNSVGAEMETAAKSAISYINQLHSQTRKWDFQWAIERDDIQFDGRSVGLALTLAILASIETIDIDAYTAFTGCVDWATGAVKRVEHLGAKLHAAKLLGIRRVYIPSENDDFEEVDGLEIVRVETINIAKQQLQNRLYRQSTTDLRSLAESKIQQVEIELRSKNIRKVNQSNQPHSCIRVEFTDGRQTIPVMVYHAQQIKPVVQGKSSSLQQIIRNEFDAALGPKITPKQPTTSGKQETRKYAVREHELQQKLERHLFNRGDATRETENNCIYRARITKGGQVSFVRQFTNGTLTIAGIPPLLEEIDAEVQAIANVASTLRSLDQPASLTQKEAQIAAVKAVELGERWVGTDESGKGDYFGPLVGAAVMVDVHIVKQLEALGVKDSKTLSDKRNQELAEAIQRICGKRAQVVPIPPERYNPLFDQFRKEGKNLNTLLAWAHTRALEDILEEFPQEQITVIVDKFGDEHFIQSKLLSQGRKTKLNLIQLPKAEANIAVAAASILARAYFLQYLKRMSVQYGIEFPKGADDRVIQVAKQILASRGRDELKKVAKLHFVTTQKVLGDK